MAYETSHTEERKPIIAFFIRYLDLVIDPRRFDKTRNDQMVFELSGSLGAVRYACGDPLFHEAVWTWLHGFLSDIGSSAQCAFLVGVFSPIITGPIPWDDPYEVASVEHILECYRDERTRWVAVEAFGECSLAESLATLDKYNRWRAAHGRSRLEMDIAELKEAVADDEVEE